MNLFKCIIYLHPSLEANKDFILKDDGTGPYILEWNADLPIPNEAEIIQAWEQIKDIPDPEPPLTPLEQLQKKQELMQQAIDDLILSGGVF
ncbi:XkdW family protein [Bacillus sp. 1NLA3E]|uniref:XkdW family protein n=1 Tax=Bacillus sp. 1NLA3E TaxID=666686 RepID=UPI000247E646|nr:XkdW family protein [Bacillus sp. 1NLA3E]AGK52039.1 hypothetical protein B1NLA3E_01275 [Bacillus sp. 1NLA3E]